MKKAFCLALAASLAILSVDLQALTQADTYFQQALAADQAGNIAERDKLLSVALKTDPDHRLARWYSGHVLHNGLWQPVTSVERTVSTDPRWKKYQDRVAELDDTLTDHAEVARWCRINGLELEEKWHWIHVLRHDADNREALGALGLRLFRGTYATADQIEAQETAEKKARLAFKHYSQLLKDAMREAERTEGSARTAATKKISSINDPAAVTAIVEIVMADAKNEKRVLDKLGKEKGEALLREIQFAAITALSSIPEHDATQSLVEIALYASDSLVRDQAASSLKGREPTSFVPQLMAGLSAPLELEISVHTLPNGQITVHEDYTEKGPLSTRKHSQSSSFLTQHVNQHTNSFAANGRIARRSRISAVWSDQWRDMANAAARVSTTQERVEVENSIREERNARIERVLQLALGKNLGDDPEKWWSDWKEYNELYTPETLPVAETRQYEDYSRYSYHHTRSVTGPPRTGGVTVPRIEAGTGFPGRNMELGPTRATGFPAGGGGGRTRSCFVAGTPVWTQSGRVPIENIKIGDLVLSQNPHTGELDYRPVIDSTVRPPSPTVSLTIGSDAIVTTRGHRFWKANSGWQMAKLLEPGDSLVTVQGTTDLQATEPGEEAPAYNLEVGEFHTYFVGNARVLVHDNTCPQPTINILPGISPRDESVPAQLALGN